MNREELAWAAGFFDGEGTTGFYRNGGYRRFVMSVPQNDPRPLERFHAAVEGLGYINWQRTGTNYVWQVQRFEHTQAVMALLWPFWSEPKREQASLAAIRYHAYKVTRMDRSESTRRGWVTRRANQSGRVG